MPAGVYYMINGVNVTPPDSEEWPPEVIGESLAGTQRRSPYRRLEWKIQVADCGRLDWFTYDNTILTSLVCTPPGKVKEYDVYTDAICQQVTARKGHGVLTEVTAMFLVNVS